MPDLGQKDSNAIRYEDQDVRRSNTDLTDDLSECILRKQLRFPEIALTHPPDALCAVYGRIFA